VQNPDDENRQTLGDMSWTSAKVSGFEAAERLQQDPESPPFAPFYWGIREHHSVDIGPPDVVKRIRKLIRGSLPKCMDRKNAQAVFDLSEFWLGARGTGARAHMDAHCSCTLSLVLGGERRWRIGPPPRMPKGAGRSPDDDVYFDDGIAYRHGWKPMFDFTVKEGEAILMPPGWIHETLNTGEGCTAALTMQFQLPPPVRYFRSYYPRLRRIGDLHACWRDMMSWGAAGTRMQPPAEGKAQEAGAKVFDDKHDSFTPEELMFYDVDRDGKVSRQEFVGVFAAWSATERAVRSERALHDIRVDVDLEPPLGSDGPPASGRAEL